MIAGASDGSSTAFVVVGLDYVSLLVMFVNARGVVWPPPFLPYHGVQLWFLGGAAVGFVLVVSSIWRDPAD